jgi:hypothetical protein
MAMTPSEMIEVLQHFVDGGSVQFRHHDAQKWRDTLTPCFNFEGFEYRIKPKPLEMWGNANNSGEFLRYSCKADAEGCRENGWRTIKVREVPGN